MKRKTTEEPFTLDSDEKGKTSISNAFRLPTFLRKKFRLEIKAAFAAIDAVHLISETKQIKLFLSGNKKDNGLFHFHRGTGEAEAIELSTKGNTMALTLLHEIGHFLEKVTIPGTDYGVRQWDSDPFTAEWRNCVVTSNEAIRLAEIIQTKQIFVTNDTGDCEPREANVKYASYLSRIEEYWARSYAQYIAEKSRSGILLEQLEVVRSSGFPYPIQWSREEFKPIAQEFDGLFRKIGWFP